MIPTAIGQKDLGALKLIQDELESMSSLKNFAQLIDLDGKWNLF